MAVREPARGDYWNASLRRPHTARVSTRVETSDGGRMAAGLAADDHQCINPRRHRLQRVLFTGDHMDADRADRLEAIEIARGSALGGDEDRNALGLEQVEDLVDALAIERQVHCEGAIGPGADCIDRAR